MITYFPENNQFIKNNFPKEIESANKHLTDGRESIQKSNKIKDSIVEKLIDRAYSLVPNTERYKDHYEFIHEVHKGTIYPDTTVRKMLLEIFIFGATHVCSGHRYDGFSEDNGSFYTYFKNKENKDGKRAETLRREKILNELNELIKEVGEFLWFTDANETAAKVSFRLNDK